MRFYSFSMQKLTLKQLLLLSIVEGNHAMRKIRYSKDVDAVLVALSDKPIAYAEDEGQFIVHFSADDEPVLLEIFDAKNFSLQMIESVLKEREVVVA